MTKAVIPDIVFMRLTSTIVSPMLQWSASVQLKVNVLLAPA